MGVSAAIRLTIDEVDQFLLKTHRTTFLRRGRTGDGDTPPGREPTGSRRTQVPSEPGGRRPRQDRSGARRCRQPSPRGSGEGVAMGCSGRIAALARGSSRAMCRATSTRRSRGRTGADGRMPRLVVGDRRRRRPIDSDFGECQVDSFGPRGLWMHEPHGTVSIHK